jgi:ABC-type spermidine/putrescine transport system permease subunit I
MLRRRLTPYAGLVPGGLLFVACFLAPLVLILLYSFWTVRDYEVVHDWTLGNYTYFLGVGTYVRTLLATLWVGAAATGIAVALGFAFAYWLARYVRASLQRFLLAVVVVPFFTSYLLRIYAWINVLGEKGAINRGLEALHVTHDPISLFLYNRTGVVIVLVYLYFPFAALTLYAALERFDWTHLRAASDLGARPFTALRLVLLPQIRPALATAAVLVMIPVLGEYLAPQLIGGTHGVMIGNLIVNFFGSAQYARGAAASILLTLVMVALLLLTRRSLELEQRNASR